MDAKAKLITPFIEDEIRDGVWDCDGNKIQGPNRFNLHFFKGFWEVVKEDAIGFFYEFHGSAVLPKAITASFLSLILKKEHEKD